MIEARYDHLSTMGCAIAAPGKDSHVVDVYSCSYCGVGSWLAARATLVAVLRRHNMDGHRPLWLSARSAAVVMLLGGPTLLCLDSAIHATRNLQYNTHGLYIYMYIIYIL